MSIAGQEKKRGGGQASSAGRKARLRGQAALAGRPGARGSHWAEPGPRPGHGETPGRAGLFPAATAGQPPPSKPRDEPGKRRERTARPGADAPPRPRSPAPARRAALTLPSSRLSPSQSNSISSQVRSQVARGPPWPPPVAGRRPPRTNLPSGPRPRPGPRRGPRAARSALRAPPRSGRQSGRRARVEPARC